MDAPTYGCPGSNDPVLFTSGKDFFETQGGDFYFRTEDEDCCGPYPTLEAARDAFAEYVKQLA